MLKEMKIEISDYVSPYGQEVNIAINEVASRYGIEDNLLDSDDDGEIESYE